VRKLLDNPAQQQQPNLRVEVSVNIARMAEKVFESSIQFKAEATIDTGVVYDLELAYAGLFQLNNMPEQMLEPFLLVNAPSLLFPYLRRLVQDLTREGGFPPLVLDPIDFGSLYLNRQREQGADNDQGELGPFARSNRDQRILSRAGLVQARHCRSHSPFDELRAAALCFHLIQKGSGRCGPAGSSLPDGQIAQPERVGTERLDELAMRGLRLLAQACRQRRRS
jgi:preprotein translocase subunit SecB